MDSILKFFSTLSNAEEIISTGGLALVTLIVFAETGLFFCFFLPGDYLLFLTGLSCSAGIIKQPIYVVIACIVVAAILGNYVGYYFGKFVGHKLYQREDSFFFKKQHLVNTKAFFDKHGGNALIIGRFLPVIRTFAPILAGTVQMKIRLFSYYVIVGALLWGISLTLMGYFLGRIFPQIIHYVHYIIIFFLVVTTWAVIKSYREMSKEKHRVKEDGK
ncbi:MAG: VTT domain-containing protein [Microscillaceae bacterium]|nr:VTT domain-containing protein [Microscillaceae bacterium]MDW8460472.1 VTT domain-containing protein [Cytophagales bacterium]